MKYLQKQFEQLRPSKFSIGNLMVAVAFVAIWLKASLEEDSPIKWVFVFCVTWFFFCSVAQVRRLWLENEIPFDARTHPRLKRTWMIIRGSGAVLLFSFLAWPQRESWTTYKDPGLAGAIGQWRH